MRAGRSPTSVDWSRWAVYKVGTPTIESNPEGGQIGLSATRSNGDLILQVSDNGNGTRSGILTQANGASVEKREGIGLSNTRQRLRQLYGDKQTLELTPRDSGGLLVSIVIPFRTITNQATAV